MLKHNAVLGAMGMQDGLKPVSIVDIKAHPFRDKALMATVIIKLQRDKRLKADSKRSSAFINVPALALGLRQKCGYHILAETNPPFIKWGQGDFNTHLYAICFLQKAGDAV